MLREIDIEVVGRAVVDSCIKVHTGLGPGLLEKVYERCMAHELKKRGMDVECQKELAINYDGLHIDGGYRLDLIVENRVIIELKSVDRLAPIHIAQLLTYLKLGHYKIGFSCELQCGAYA